MDYIIITAGGKGLRMGGDIPKQFMPVKGVPVLMRTIRRFREYSPTLRIILVLPKAQQQYWRELCREYAFNEEYTIVDGGETRFHSVRNGLDTIPDTEEGVVGVHDGVRPFVAVDVIERCYETARRTGAVIPVTPVVETLRYVGDGKEQRNVLRSDYRLVQTPQAFDIQLLKKANRQPYSEAFTDDASIVESIGATVTMVDGNRENIKLTTPFDMTVAMALAE
ncbi:MAG: 2-C-methyl-D-erythritol 4-phosphate cytidylyltransferase [Prevotellaceae bacterium]|nr:2-C-methyl-D-erythritol 4-phosphate cytidylyltransferase [Prevotellaceae bacterium]